MAVRDFDVQEVWNQIDAEASRRLVELGGKLKHEVRASSIEMTDKVRGQASHTGLEAFRVMDRVFYDSITLLWDALSIGIGGVRASVVTGLAGETDWPVEVVGAPSVSGAMAASDVHVVVVEEAACDVMASDVVKNDAAVGVPPGKVSSDPVSDPVSERGRDRRCAV